MWRGDPDKSKYQKRKKKGKKCGQGLWSNLSLRYREIERKGKKEEDEEQD